MEVDGTRDIMNLFKKEDITVQMLTTDRNSAVINMMQREFDKTRHVHDAWHVGKTLSKELREQSKKKRSAELKDFMRGIKNHFWYSVTEAKGDGKLCQELFISCLFHVIGCHTFTLGNICEQLTAFIKTKVGNNKKNKTKFEKFSPENCSAFFKVS